MEDNATSCEKYKGTWGNFHDQNGEDICLDEHSKFLVKRTGGPGGDWYVKPLTGRVVDCWKPDEIPMVEADENGNCVLISKPGNFYFKGNPAVLKLIIEDENPDEILVIVEDELAGGGSARGNKQPGGG